MKVEWGDELLDFVTKLIERRNALEKRVDTLEAIVARENGGAAEPAQPGEPSPIAGQTVTTIGGATETVYGLTKEGEESLQVHGEPSGEVTTEALSALLARLKLPEEAANEIRGNVIVDIRRKIARATAAKDATIAELSRSLRGAEAEGREKGRSEYDRAMHTLESALQSIGRLNDAEDVFHQADRELRTLNLNLGLSRTAKDVLDQEIVRLRQQHEADAARANTDKARIDSLRDQLAAMERRVETAEHDWRACEQHLKLRLEERDAARAELEAVKKKLARRTALLRRVWHASHMDDGCQEKLRQVFDQVFLQEVDAELATDQAPAGEGAGA